MSGLNPPPPDPPLCSQRGPSQVSVTAGTVLPALLLASFPGGYIHRVPLVQLHRMTVPVPCPFALFKIFRHPPGVNSLGFHESECVHVTPTIPPLFEALKSLLAVSRAPYLHPPPDLLRLLLGLRSCSPPPHLGPSHLSSSKWSKWSWFLPSLRHLQIGLCYSCCFWFGSCPFP